MPVIGPLIVKILSVGFIWLLNGVGYLVSFIAIKRGYAKDVLTYRGLTVAVIIGIVIGFILGRLICESRVAAIAYSCCIACR